MGAHDAEAVGQTYGCRVKGKYLNLTSFKRDGTGVSTPVWFVQENGRLFVRTDGDSYAEIHRNGEAQHVDELMARKYRLDKILILPIYRAVQRIRGRRTSEADPVVLAITPE